MKKTKLILLVLIISSFCAQSVFSQEKEITDDIYATSPDDKQQSSQNKKAKYVVRENLDVDFNDSIGIVSKYVYCEIVSTEYLSGTKVRIQIDYGQEVGFWSSANARTLKDEAGKAIKFNSMVDALNYMGNLGWEFVQAYTITVNNSIVYHFLLKRKVYLEQEE